MAFLMKYIIYQFLFCLLTFQNLLSANHADPIHIVYHVSTINNWDDIVKEQIITISDSGLGETCQSLSVMVVGTDIHKVYPLFENLSYSDKIEIIHAGDDYHLFEFPSMERVQQIARDYPTSKILYMHTKGVSYYGTPAEKNIQQWRRFMEYFCVHKWKACVEALETAECCGVDWGLSACGIPCYAGNYWWVKANYVPRCILYRNSRFDCEIFIGTGNPIARNLCSSGTTPQLKKLCTQEELREFQMFPKDVFYHKAMFHFTKYFFEDSYFKD